MIDFNRWFGGLTGEQPEEDESAVAKTLRLLQGAGSTVQQGATDLYTTAAAGPSPAFGEAVRGAVGSAYEALPSMPTPPPGFAQGTPEAEEHQAVLDRRSQVSAGLQGAGSVFQRADTGLTEAAMDSSNAVDTLKRAGQAGASAFRDEMVADDPLSVAKHVMLPGLSYNDAAQAGIGAGLGEIGRGIGRAAGTSEEPLGTVPFFGPISSEDVASGIAQTVLDPTNLVGGGEARVAVRGGAPIARETLEAGGRALVRGAGGFLDDVGRRASGLAGALTPGVDEGEMLLGSGNVPRRVPRAAPTDVEPTGRGAIALAAAEQARLEGAPASRIEKLQSLAAADLGDQDDLVRAIQTGPVTTTATARAMLGDRPEYLEPVVQFLLEQRQKLMSGGMTARDVGKAYYMTLMSMRAKLQNATDMEQKMARGFTTGTGEVVPPNPEMGNLDGMVNPRTGDRLGALFAEADPETGARTIRPESLGAAWVWTTDGQRALDGLSAGQFDADAWKSGHGVRKALGLDTIGGNSALRPLTASEVADGKVNMTNLPAFVEELNQGIARMRAQGREADIGPWMTEQARRMMGIGEAKTAFIKQLIGMGDGLTIDAREINYWLSGSGLLNKTDTSRGANMARAASAHWSNPRVAQALRARIEQAVDELTRTHPELLEGIDPREAGEAIHHWIWDKSAGSETTHAAEMYTQRLGAGVVDRARDSIPPGLRAQLGADAYNAAQGGVFGAASESLEAGQQDREADFGEQVRRGAIGAGLAVAAGRGVGQGRAQRGLERAARAGGGLLPKMTPSPTISELGRRLMEKYTAVTPARAEASTATTVETMATAIQKRIDDAAAAGSAAGKPLKGPGMQAAPDAFIQSVHDAIVDNLADTKIIATGIRGEALQAYLRGQGLTSKVDTRDLGEINKITQGQVNVAGGRNGKPYTIGEAAGFAQRESEQFRGVTGGTRMPDPETGAIDEEAPRVMYAYVSEGQPLIGPNRPTVWIVWEDGTPRVTSAHHPYGLLSDQDIHAGMQPGIRSATHAEGAVAGGRWAPSTLDQGGNLVEAAPGVTEGAQGVMVEPLLKGWESQGLEIGGHGPSGDPRKIMDTNWLVGPEGEDAMRANGLVLGMNQGIQDAIASGRMADPEGVAAALMRGGAPKWKGGWGSVMNPSRSESLVIDPSISHIKALYISGVPKDLLTKIKGGGKGGARVTELEFAQRLRADVAAQHGGKDIPIYFNDISQSAPSAAAQKAGASMEGWAPTQMPDAQLLEGPDVPLSPGRGRIVDRYVQETDPSTGRPYTNLGSGVQTTGPMDPAEAAARAAASAQAAARGAPPASTAPTTPPSTTGVPTRRAAAAAAAGPQPTPPPPTGLRAFSGVQSYLAAKQQRAADLKARNVTAPSAWDWMKQAGFSGVYGPATAASSAIGGATELALAQPKELVRALTSGNAGSYGRQVKAQAGVMRESMSGLKRVLLGSGSEGAAAASGGSQGTAGLSDRVADPIARFAARAMERPGELLTEAPDAVFRPLFRAQGMQREADRIAREMGLKGDKANSYADTLMQTAEALRASPGTRSTSAEAQRVVDAGESYADELGYKGTPGAFGQWLAKLGQRDDFVGVAAQFLMPFPAMAARMTTAGARMTPGVGALPALNKGRGTFDVLYDQGLGTLAGAGVAGYAFAGGITGSGPDDPEKRKMMVSQGWQPNSTLVNGYYVPNRAFGRFQGLLDTAGELHDAMAYGKKDRRVDEWASEIGKRVSKIASDQTGLSGLADLHDMFEGNLGGQSPGFAARAAIRYLPWGGVLRAEANRTDPTARRADRPSADTGWWESFGQNVETAIPGLRSDVPAATDSLGREMPNPQAGFGAVIPKTTVETPDPTIQAFQTAGVDIGDPPDQAGDFIMTTEEKRAWNTARGAELQKRLTPAIEALPPERRTERMRDVLAAAGEAADRFVERQIPTADRARRRREGVLKKAS